MEEDIEIDCTAWDKKIFLQLLLFIHYFHQLRRLVKDQTEFFWINSISHLYSLAHNVNLLTLWDDCMYVSDKTNTVSLSPQANYTDWATPTCRRNLVPTFADRGVSRGQRSGYPTAINLSFLDPSRYYFFQKAPQLSSWGWVDPIPDPLLLRTSGSAENRTWDLWLCSQELWPLDHKGGL
jgi:hypothetical protein